MGRLKGLLTASAVGCAASLIFLQAAFTSPHTIPSVLPDALEFIWAVWWERRWLSGAAPDFYFSQAVFHPAGASLVLHAMAEGLTLPWAALLPRASALFVYNVCCLFCFLANYLAAFLLFRRLAASQPAAGLAALVLAFHPFFIGHLQAGHLNFLCFFPVLIALHAALRFCEDGRNRALLPLAGAMAVLPFLNLYYAYFLLLAVPLLGIGYRAGRLISWRAWLALCFALAAGLLPALPKLYPLAALHASAVYTPDHAAGRHSADAADLLLPGVNQLVAALVPHPASALNVGESGVYLGYGLMLLFLLN